MIQPQVKKSRKVLPHNPARLSNRFNAKQLLI